MKALKDNCVITNFDVDLSKENNNTLQNLFGNNRVIAVFDIPDGSASKFSAPFTVYNKSLLYNKFFTVVPVQGTESFSIYITTSLLNKGNVIKMVNDYYEYDGTMFRRTVQPNLLRPHMEGIFGFRKIQLGSNSVPIEVCYPVILTTHDAHYHFVSEKDDPTKIQIMSELPERYPIENFFKNIMEFGEKLLPLSLNVEASLSATVRKSVR